MQNENVSKFALLMNIAIAGTQYLGILWFFGTFQQFKSIFESMNVQLPRITILFLQLSDLSSGFLFYLIAFVLLVLCVLSMFACWNFPEVSVVLPLTNAIQMIGFLFAFISGYSVFMPMLTLVNGG